MWSAQALAIDAMLPALPTIAHALGVNDENHAQWIITAYVAGMGTGQLFWGMLSDRFGRRTILLVGFASYAVAALLAGLSNSFHSLLAWRFIHGVAAASIVVSRSVIRDLYEGRQMARVMSLSSIVFIMVPIIAPTIGQAMLLIAPWRYLFVLFSVFAGFVFVWVAWRLPETLHPEYRRTLTSEHLGQALQQVLGDRSAMCYTFAVTLIFGSIIAYVGMVQQVFADVFHRASAMPTMFALCAASIGVASFTNSRIVMRLGMRVVSQAGLLLYLVIAVVHAVAAASGMDSLVMFVALQALLMYCMGLMIGNFNTMAMEPMGPVAGIAASLQGAISSVGGALVGASIGHFFDGTTVPLTIGAVLCGLVTLGLVLIAESGKMFRPHHAGTSQVAQ
jgi:DHA1 family bicyclomycin/chloramphenicol resistance-like MFS transporter